MRIFHVNFTRVGVELIEVTSQVISELLRIPVEGELINKGHTNFDEVISLFYKGNEKQPELHIHKGITKGVNRSSLEEPWKTTVLWLMKFFICEGQYGIVLGLGMRLLIHLRYANTRPEAQVNLRFLFSHISSMTARVKEKDGHIKYPSLIHLIEKHHFLKKELGKEQWLNFFSSPIRKVKKGPMLKSLKIEKGEPSSKKKKRADKAT